MACQPPLNLKKKNVIGSGPLLHFLILLLATMAERTKRSKAWLHFNKAEDKAEATCNIR